MPAEVRDASPSGEAGSSEEGRASGETSGAAEEACLDAEDPMLVAAAGRAG